MNWKTTVAGIAAIIAAIAGTVSTVLKTGTVPDLTAVIAAIVAGWGLIFAKDATNTK